MKKLILIATVLISFTCYSQTKDSTSRKDTTHKDTITVAIILSEQEFQNLITMIKGADEKPSLIEKYISFISSRTQIIPKQQPQIPQTNGKPKGGK